VIQITGRGFISIGQRLSNPRHYGTVYMISSTSNFFSWASLELVPGLCAMPASWKRQLGPNFDAFRARFLRVNPAIANIPELPVEHVPLEFNWKEFGGHLADALELRRKLISTGFPQTYQVGAWSDAAVPVFLSILSDERDFALAAMGLAALMQQRFILFAPTHHHLTGQVQGVLNAQNAEFFTLEANIRLTETGRLLAMRAPAQLFTRFTPPPDTKAESAAKAAFALLGRLDSQTSRCKAPLPVVMRLYCLDGLEADQIATRCRCARSLVYNRLQALRKELGCHPAALRQHSAHLDQLRESLSDSRARHIRTRAAMECENETEG
jgi:hypothetical protein